MLFLVRSTDQEPEIKSEQKTSWKRTDGRSCSWIGKHAKRLRTLQAALKDEYDAERVSIRIYGCLLQPRIEGMDDICGMTGIDRT